MVLVTITKDRKCSVLLASSNSSEFNNPGVAEKLIKWAEDHPSWLGFGGEPIYIVNLSRIESYEYKNNDLMIRMMSGLSFVINAPERTYKNFEKTLSKIC